MTLKIKLKPDVRGWRRDERRGGGTPGHATHGHGVQAKIAKFQVSYPVMARKDSSHIWRSLAIAILMVAALLWAYWPVLATMGDRWAHDPRYSHGFLVPVFSLSLLWTRRGRLAGARIPGSSRPSVWGLALIVTGAGIYGSGAAVYNDWLQSASLLPFLAGIALLVGGRVALVWSWPAVAFLLFMAPLPYRIEMALGWPLQRVATLASTYALQTAGIAALGEGNIIRLSGGTLGVAEACSGLSMMILFFALSTGLAMVIHRPLFDRIVIVTSAIPIALVANIARITATGIVHETIGSRFAELVFHDFAGWLMMPLALILLWAEVVLLARLLPEVTDSDLGGEAMVPAKSNVGSIAATLKRSLKHS